MVVVEEDVKAQVHHCDFWRLRMWSVQVSFLGFYASWQDALCAVSAAPPLPTVDSQCPDPSPERWKKVGKGLERGDARSFFSYLSSLTLLFYVCYFNTTLK